MGNRRSMRVWEGFVFCGVHKDFGRGYRASSIFDHA